MKRASDIYKKIYDYENLAKAYLKASKGKKRKKSVIKFSKNFEENILNLQKQFETSDYDIGNYYYFKINDPKPRDICASSFKERVFHHAVMNVCEPFFESYAVFSSYACRKDKGMHKAVLKAKEYSKKYGWFLKLDIKKYFDSIDHKILLNLLQRKFKDKNLLHLFEKVIDSYHLKEGKGLPIGNLMSQHMANYYLGFFDHFIKEDKKIKGYIRYMDDFLIFGKTRHELKKALNETENFLDAKLKLEPKKNIILNRTKKGIPFLGYLVFPYKIRLSKASAKRFTSKFMKYEKNFIKGTWYEDELVRHVEALLSFTEISNGRNFKNNIIKKYGVIS